VAASTFLEAARLLPVDRTPVWIMRQAGRYLPQYRKIREKASFMQMCKTPELAAEVTIQPVDGIGVDAAILFSDILIPAEAMGVRVEFSERGPSLTPARDRAAIEALRVPEPHEAVPFVMDAIRLIVRELSGRGVPLIGFAGAPWTLASYIVEGGGSKDFAVLKRLMYSEPSLCATLLDKIADTTAAYLRAQIEAGAAAVQLFDTWAGALSAEDYESYALPYVRKITAALSPLGAPVIYYANGVSHLLPLLPRTGATVLGLDWRVSLGRARDTLGPGLGVQGNLDPCVLLGPIEGIRRRVQGIIAGNAGRPGHVFNLGHGILPETPVDSARAMVDAVHELSSV
jgi:uroporphyrinogen decarboxylase